MFEYVYNFKAPIQTAGLIGLIISERVYSVCEDIYNFTSPIKKTGLMGFTRFIELVKMSRI